MENRKDVSKLRAFGCRIILYLEEARRAESGRFGDRGTEGINLGPAIDANTSGYKIYLLKEKIIRISNQVKFDESYFPMKEAAMRRMPHLVNEILGTEDEFPPEEGDYSVSYYPSLLHGGFKIEYRDVAQGIYKCRSIDFPRCTFQMTEEQYREQLYSSADRAGAQVLQNSTLLAQAQLGNTAASVQAMSATVLPPPPFPPPDDVPVSNTPVADKEGIRMRGLPNSIDPTKPPRNYKDAMSRSDYKDWNEAYFKEYQGTMDRGAVKAMKPPPGVPEQRFWAPPLGWSTKATMECSPRESAACVYEETSKWKERTSFSKTCMHPR